MSDKPKPNPSHVAYVRYLGRVAHGKGIKAAPALDPAMGEVIKNIKGPMGTAIPYLDAWNQGWHEANLADDSPGIDRASRRLMRYAADLGLDWTIVHISERGEPVAFRLAAQNGKPVVPHQVIGETEENAHGTISLAAHSMPKRRKR